MMVSTMSIMCLCFGGWTIVGFRLVMRDPCAKVFTGTDFLFLFVVLIFIDGNIPVCILNIGIVYILLEAT